jgi:CheY-like chemotaxis protein
MKDLKIDEAVNGLAAVQAFKNQIKKTCLCNNRFYRVIFMDIQMPVMDGIQACRDIIKLMEENIQDNSKCVIIFQTANYSVKNHRSCISAGGTDVLNKPV